MDLTECIVISILKRIGRTSIDRLARLTFLVDRLGGFEAFDWDRVDLVITSPTFLDLIEKMESNNTTKRIENFIILMNNDYEPDCGWLKDRINSTIDYVINKYGSLNDEELEDAVETIYEGVY
jgi:hypothetical protein|nr:MAG: hypothetical protein TU36_06605 [Vulcanisaeta sp. AZ3]